jgi:hypothetical protein
MAIEVFGFRNISLTNSPTAALICVLKARHRTIISTVIYPPTVYIVAAWGWEVNRNKKAPSFLRRRLKKLCKLYSLFEITG